jgi:hypothetical protein
MCSDGTVAKIPSVTSPWEQKNTAGGPARSMQVGHLHHLHRPVAAKPIFPNVQSIGPGEKSVGVADGGKVANYGGLKLAQRAPVRVE